MNREAESIYGRALPLTVHHTAYVDDYVEIGERVHVHCFASIGTAPFSYTRDDAGRLVKKQRTRAAFIGDDVEIMAHANVDAGLEVPTRVGRGTKIDHYAHVGHDSQVGEDVVVCAQAFIGGFVEIGDRAYIGAQACIKPRVKIGAGAKVGMGAVVIHDVPPGATVAGCPARVIRAAEVTA